MSFGDFLRGCLDSLFAPPSIHDTSSSVSGMESSAAHDMQRDPEPAWHNEWGTAADHQVPAESGYAFETRDWSGGDSFSSFDSGSWSSGSGMDW